MYLPDYKASHLSCHYLLMLQHTRIFVLYRNYRKSSEAHCDQQNQKVATQTCIQRIFQLLHEPVQGKERYNDVTEENILCRILFYIFIPAIFVVIMINIGVTWLIILEQGEWGEIGHGY